MIKSYPEKVKTEIATRVKEGVKNGTKVLTAEVTLTDYQKINEIRAAYFNVEKAVSFNPVNLTNLQIY